jgi:hypothetical protein
MNPKVLVYARMDYSIKAPKGLVGGALVPQSMLSQTRQ